MYAVTYNGKKYSANEYYPFGATAQTNPTLFASKEDAERARASIANSYRMGVECFEIAMVG